MRDSKRERERKIEREIERERKREKETRGIFIISLCHQCLKPLI